ncbi:hypothetical protein PAXRUDRAFT_835283, partial [Paxillus rubicundulus Ve08.2h10]
MEQQTRYLMTLTQLITGLYKLVIHCFRCKHNLSKIRSPVNDALMMPHFFCDWTQLMAALILVETC